MKGLMWLEVVKLEYLDRSYLVKMAKKPLENDVHIGI